MINSTFAQNPQLNTEYFIAGRMVSGKKSNFSRPFIIIAVTSIALGLTTMFLSIVILNGFQKAVREKVIGFGGHIQIQHFQETQSLEPIPIARNPEFLPKIKAIPGVKHVQAYATKAGIIKTEDQIQGMVMKGVGTDYDWSFFSDKMVAGHLPAIPDTGRSNDVIISKTIADLLGLKVNDDIRMYFIAGDNVLGRKFRISGIYQSGMTEFDKMYVIGDLRHIQKLNQWSDSQVGGFEVLISDFRDLDRIGEEVYQDIGFALDSRTIVQLYPQIFDWLKLQDINVVIILALMILVGSFTMISTLLILILERTQMIGTLKALGMRNAGIRQIFLYNSLYIIGIGMLIGNIAGFAFTFLQQRYGFLKLPEEAYYVPVVPVDLNIWYILLLNAGSMLICYLMLIVPSMVITRISPVKAIRYR